MKRQIKIFKPFKEQEQYFLEYFFHLSPTERTGALSELQKKERIFESDKKNITIKNVF